MCQIIANCFKSTTSAMSRVTVGDKDVITTCMFPQINIFHYQQKEIEHNGGQRLVQDVFIVYAAG